jgi:putative transposase
VAVAATNIDSPHPNNPILPPRVRHDGPVVFCVLDTTWTAAACCRFSPASLLARTACVSKVATGHWRLLAYPGLSMESLPDDDACAKGTQDWPHAPPHRLRECGVYFLTARCADRRHLLADNGMKDWFQETLLKVAGESGWRLEAWAILSNHYHLVGHSPKGPDGAESLRQMIRKLHSLTTKELNRRENRAGRTRLWQNFRETYLTHQQSYLARLHYVHQNAVHHRLVHRGSDWKWCSAAAFKRAVTPAWLKTIASFRYDEIAAKDQDDP